MTGSETAVLLNRRFNTDYSRNAVIGRAMRKGIVTKNAALGRPRKPRSRKGEATAIGIVERTQRRRTAPAPQQFACDETGLRVADVVPLHLSLLELEAGQCRWPYGDGSAALPYTFCGCPQFDGSSYCDGHAALAMRELDGRSRERPDFVRMLKKNNRSVHEGLNSEVFLGNEDAA